MLSAFAAHVVAQTVVQPEDEYKKLISVSEDIRPLGDNPFGERISLYDGSLSFRQVDVSIPGTGPTISVGRELVLHNVDDRPDLQNRAFGDWDIDLPLLTTTTANQNNVEGWLIASSEHPNWICSYFREPPSVAAPGGDSQRADWEPKSWWTGYQMHIPGQGNQELLKRSQYFTATPGVQGLAYPIVTKENWALGCLSEPQDKTTTQGFLAVSPDGTKYWFNHISYRYMPNIYRPLDSGPGLRAAKTDGSLKPMALDQDMLARREGRMLVTRIEDRFGNSVDYLYNDDKVTDITASDGRHVSITYQDATPRISTVIVQGGAAGTRTWTYSYTKVGLLYTLSNITQPDGSNWTFDLGTLDNEAWVDMRLSAGTCNTLGTPANLGMAYPGTMTHPSGLVGTFTVTPLKRGRSNVPRACAGLFSNSVDGPGTYAEIPNASYGMAITHRQLAGAGIPTQNWDYAYSPANDSWKQTCNGCATTVWTTVTYPDQHTERSTFSNAYDYSETLLQSVEAFDGAPDTTTRRRLTTYDYVNPDPAKDSRSSVLPQVLGYAQSQRVNDAQYQLQFPLGRQAITDEHNDSYIWAASAIDGFARPTTVDRYSQFAGDAQPAYKVTEVSAFADDYSRWLLGMPLYVDNATTGERVTENVYDPATITLSERRRFGQKVMGYTFDEHGQLSTFTDGRGNTTTLGVYKRGIPTVITYADSTSQLPDAQTIAVDDLGQITAVTNQLGATTAYTYDAIGRVGSITYPNEADPTWSWNAKTFSYEFVRSAVNDRDGLTGSYWRRRVTQRDANGVGREQVTLLDAMLRPVISDIFRDGGILDSSTRTDYDWRGQTTFSSYASALPVGLGSRGDGVTSTYDSLGRLSQTFRHSELGDLTTTTEYLPRAQKRVTDPSGQPTLTSYQVFDQPSYENLVRVEAPEQVTQTVTRDVYGNPLSIEQGGNGQSLVKTMTYDSNHRLCRSWEPESGSEVVAYDDANNVSWSASGEAISDTGCGQSEVDDGRKIVRQYDQLNRVRSVIYPSGVLATSFTYDALGNTATATASSPAPNGLANTVSWTYGRNRLGLLTAEVLSVDGWSWTFGYGYDKNTSPSTVMYPDGEIVTYSPDGLGRATTAGSYLGAISYFPDGDVASYGLGNGASYVAQKNGRKLLGSFAYGKGASLDVSQSFQYDANGNVGSIAGVEGGSEWTKVMEYDHLNRLVKATADDLWGVEQYTYDTLNNIRSLSNGGSESAYNYDAFTNRLVSISSNGVPVHTFDYDGRGNLKTKDAQTLHFDLANRLTSIDGNASYLYDAAGRRVKKITSGATTYYAYNSAGQLMFEYDNATTNGTNYVYLGKKLVASSKGSNSSVTGTIDSFVDGANASLGGWACSTGLTTSLDVRLYAGGPAGTGTSVGVYHANIASEPAIQVPCHAAGSKYRFSITFAEADRIAFAGKPLYVYGISVTGGADVQLTGSGTHSMPASIRAPNPPAATSASLSGDLTTITVNWSATTNTTSYKLEQQYNGSATWTAAFSGTATSKAISNPADGTYVFRASACNANGCSNPTVSNVVTVAHIPPAPSGITVPSTSTGAVPVSWPAAPYATIYRLEHTYTGGWTEVYAGAATSTTVSEGVSAGWYYRVRACNANGCSGYTTSAPVSVLLPPTTPPTLNGGGTSTNGAYGLNWSASPGATSYNLIENVNGAGWTSVQNNGAQSWSTAGRGNGTYYYMVQGCNASACTNWSNQVAVTVSNIPPTPPRPTATVHVIDTKKRTVRVDWAAQPYATRYELTENNILVASGTDVFYSNLQTAGSRLTYVVRACNASGCSAWSASVTANP
jgi:YD repeat-containing protein